VFCKEKMHLVHQVAIHVEQSIEFGRTSWLRVDAHLFHKTTGSHLEDSRLSPDVGEADPSILGRLEHLSSLRSLSTQRVNCKRYG